MSLSELIRSDMFFMMEIKALYRPQKAVTGGGGESKRSSLRAYDADVAVSIRSASARRSTAMDRIRK